MDGVLLVDKPKGPTSHDILLGLRRRFSPEIRIGHAGTLDPQASGLLIVLVGAARKLQERFQDMDKVYEGELSLGIKTDTGDLQGKVIEQAPIPLLDEPRIKECLKSFLGPLRLEIPSYSAKKMRGGRFYDYARRGKPLPKICGDYHIRRLELTGFENSKIRFEAECSSGTYIRSLAQAVAERLGTVGTLSGLKRTAIGPYRLDRALSYDELLQRPDPLALHLSLICPQQLQ